MSADREHAVVLGGSIATAPSRVPDITCDE
jgi:hypothetical protein